MPRDSRMAPREAAAMPFPRLETTPPVTKMYFVMQRPPGKRILYRKATRSVQERVAKRLAIGVGRVVPAQAGTQFSFTVARSAHPIRAPSKSESRSGSRLESDASSPRRRGPNFRLPSHEARTRFALRPRASREAARDWSRTRRPRAGGDPIFVYRRTKRAPDSRSVQERVAKRLAIGVGRVVPAQAGTQFSFTGARSAHPIRAPSKSESRSGSRLESDASSPRRRGPNFRLPAHEARTRFALRPRASREAARDWSRTRRPRAGGDPIFVYRRTKRAPDSRSVQERVAKRLAIGVGRVVPAQAGTQFSFTGARSAHPIRA